ncbi:MAG: hypothetical protein Q8910_00660 [Bacteroidota bacterium]|nr:hypothetical protein [Bacteroidota bacterium]
MDKIPNPYFEGEYIYVPDENGEEWAVRVMGVDLAKNEDMSITDYPTQPIEPIDSDPLSPAKGIVRGLLYSLPIWIAAGFVLWAVGKGRWW